MRKTRIQGRLAGFLGILILSATLPACKSPDGSRRSLFGTPAPDSTNTVLRPPYEWPNTKPLYVSGYAGANYEPGIRARPVYSSSAAPTLPSHPPTITVDQGTWDSN